ncbi:MAG: 30S ribosomal protein S16 [Candidatus Eremiobacteraeota bacterium]|nr:30S ribosomal protein S16 [Candidatus Eremiobacteraeota bacterium]MBV8366630.1 30S ribosomal protein S16 [Candidatus Eremiobacteraeota bacterium]
MAVKIRLRRTGAKKQASYRVVVADSGSPRDGRFIEIIGHFNPRRQPAELVLDEDKVKRWLGNGAQPSDTVARLLADKGLFDKSKVPTRKPREKRKGKANA